MKKKLIGIFVCTLLILTAIPAVGIMNIKTNDAVSKHESASSDPEPKVCCFGSIDQVNVKVGGVVLGDFQVYNCGDKDSLLNWEIVSWPDWGEWEFDHFSGTGLQKDVYHTVTVSVEVPDKPEKSFTGDIKIVNSDDPSDFGTINVYIITARAHSSFYHFLEQFPLLARLFSLPIFTSLLNLK